jgi:hydrogenase-4 component B
MSTILASPLSSCLALLAGWILIGIAGLVRPMSVQFAGRTLFLAGALCGVGIAVVGCWALASPAEQVVLPIGLPDLPFHLRLDALSAVFLLLLGVASVGISIFGAGYFRSLWWRSGTAAVPAASSGRATQAAVVCPMSSR